MADDGKPPESPVADIVQTLHDLLAQAERGELAGLACTYVTSDQRLFCDCVYAGPIAGELLATGASRLLYRLSGGQD